MLPSGASSTSQLDFNFDASNRITSVSGRIASITYDLRDNPLTIAFTSGADETWTYSATRGWPTNIKVLDASGATWMNTSYTYSAAGRVLTQNSRRTASTATAMTASAVFSAR